MAAPSSHIEATLNYVDELPPEKPAFYVRQRVPTDRRKGPVMGPHEVAIHDARGLATTLDEEGVALVEHEHEFEDFNDPEAVRATYLPEVEALVRRHTGARRVLAFDHNLRSTALARAGLHDAQMPVRFAHNDYTDTSAPQRVRDLLPDEAESLLTRRFAVINVWRPVRTLVESDPLAVCDARTLPEDHMIAMDLIYPDRVGEVQYVLYEAGHRWLYFPRMEPHEVMLLKCFDSARDGRARFTAHSAFEDPTTPAGAPARESVEVRTLAFF